MYESGQEKLKSDNKNLDKAVFTLFKNVCSNKIPVNRNVIKEKSLSLAKSLDLADFQASNWWIDKWKQRHSVTLQAVSGEENVVAPEMKASWNETYLPTILAKYKLRDIHNTKEFGLFYQALQRWALQ